MHCIPRTRGTSSTNPFCFRSHTCITFELLSINLYELIKKNKFQGFSLQLVRKFAHSLLQCLDTLYRNKIIHCDMKPENVLLKQQGRSGIKVRFPFSMLVSQPCETNRRGKTRAKEIIFIRCPPEFRPGIWRDRKRSPGGWMVVVEGLKCSNGDNYFCSACPAPSLWWPANGSRGPFMGRVFL